MSPRTSESEKRRLSPRDWVAAAYEAMAEHGIEGVRIDELADRLGVTKGSFYWHFKGREELLDAVAEAWASPPDNSPVQEALAQEADHRTRLELLFGLGRALDLQRYARAMRSWAQVDSRAGRAIETADERSQQYLKRLFEEMGFGPQHALLRARVIHLCSVGRMMSGEQSDDDDDLRRLFLDLLLAPPGEQEAPEVSSERIEALVELARASSTEAELAAADE